MAILSQKAKISENGPRAILKAETLLSSEMDFERCFEKELCESDGKFKNQSEKERYFEVLHSENLIQAP